MLSPALLRPPIQGGNLGWESFLHVIFPDSLVVVFQEENHYM
ncbi:MULTISPECIES: hypothetical protein [unclassified Halomonas]|nr:MULTISPECIES: hypothetical protein [unclassified Halomonas]